MTPPDSSHPPAGVPADRRAGGDFAPTASWEMLRLRADLLRRLRRFFDDQGFLEVETPLLSADTVVDRHLDPIPVRLFDDPRTPQQGSVMWLQTSPEFAMKRLLASGGEAIYQVTRAFRGGEQGARHNPEFTMVEWYRLGDRLQQGMDLLAELAESLLDVGPVERLSYGAAFQRHVGLDPHTSSLESLAQAALARGLIGPEQWQTGDSRWHERDDWLNLLLAECVEPHLGAGGPTLLFDYPASQAALARVREQDPPVAERFELYLRGVELANGYHELLDPEVLRRRNRTMNAQRAADGKYRLPEESRLLTAMEHGLPPCAGVALGFDRLVMVAAGKQTLAEVMAFPRDRA